MGSLFLSTASERDKDIVCSRFGLDGFEQQTLQQIGDRFDISRERIRQLESTALKEVMSSLSLTSTVIRLNITENLTHEFSHLYSILAARFYNEDQLFQFFEHISDADKGELQEIINPNFDVSVIENWFLTNPAPILIDSAAELLKEQFGCGTKQAINGIYQAMDQGKFTIDRQWVTPRSLKKMIAVSQAALAFPEGVGFREIHKFANEQGFCKSEFPLERQEHGIQESVNDGYIYLCGHGRYKHTQFLMLNDESINLIIDEAFGCLKHSSINGNKSLHLKMNVYEKSPILKNYDYFDVRHVIRAFGERKGVFFAGKSGADTVSFDENVRHPSYPPKVVCTFFAPSHKFRQHSSQPLSGAVSYFCGHSPF